jgi:ketosteroid isomerase-like protein
MEKRAETARTYYRAIDGGEYDRLREILASGFVHDRPDQTLSGPDRFVRFMREERPMTDTTHAVDALYDATGDGEDHGNDRGEVAVRGRLRHEGEDLFGFVDVFTVEGGDIARLRTYTR